MEKYILLLLCSCQLNNKLNLFSTDRDVAAFIKDLSKEINGEIGCEAIASDQFAEDRRWITIERNTAKAIKANGGDPDTNGFYDPITETIYIIEFSFEFQLMKMKAVIIHELGHAMGLEHEKGTIMDAIYHHNGLQSVEIAAKSLADLLRKYKLSPCKR